MKFKKAVPSALGLNIKMTWSIKCGPPLFLAAELEAKK